MVLKYPSAWRYNPPQSDDPGADVIPGDAQSEFLDLIRKIGTQGDLKEFLEHFKGHYALANGDPYYSSSNTDCWDRKAT